MLTLRFETKHEYNMHLNIYKLLSWIDSKDFGDLECNCNTAPKIDGECIYNSKCRSYIFMYKATCKDCNTFYIRNTQHHLKKRMNQHLSEVRSTINKN